MKRVIALLAVACLLMSLCACSNGTQPDKTEPQNDQTQGSQSTEPTGNDNAFFFKYNGTEIRLHADAAPIVAALGEPKSYTEETSCAFEGLDKTYTYDSFILQTYPQGDKDYVYCFWFVDDLVQTNEGIRIGDDQAKVESAYGAEAYNGSNAYILTEGDTTFTVILEEGVVTSIQYAVSIG